MKTGQNPALHFALSFFIFCLYFTFIRTLFSPPPAFAPCRVSGQEGQELVCCRDTAVGNVQRNPCVKDALSLVFLISSFPGKKYILHKNFHATAHQQGQYQPNVLDL